MASILGSTPTDLHLMHIACELAQHLYPKSSDTSIAWDELDGSYNQTEKGLVIVLEEDKPTQIHSPFGSWKMNGNIPYSIKGKIFSKLESCAKLKLFDEIVDPLTKKITQSWAIIEWRCIILDEPQYRDSSNFIPRDTVKERWKVFVDTRRIIHAQAKL
jgi:hypothetical protein